MIDRRSLFRRAAGALGALLVGREVAQAVEPVPDPADGATKLPKAFTVNESDFEGFVFPTPGQLIGEGDIAIQASDSWVVTAEGGAMVTYQCRGDLMHVTVEGRD